MANILMGSVWYLDSDALFHMKGCREFFSDLEEKDLHIHIDLGEDRRYNVTRIGTVTFKRESISLLRLKYVMFVPGLKNNLSSVVVLEDRGYDFILSKGKEFLRHMAIGQAKHIRVCVKNLYNIYISRILLH